MRKELKTTDRQRENARNYYSANRETVLGKLRTARLKNPEQFRMRNHVNYCNRRPAGISCRDQWRINNEVRRVEKLQRKKILAAQRRENRRLWNNLRSRIAHAVRRQSGEKAKKTRDITGCTVEFLRGYLEAQFQPGMSWDNYGRRGWHIDHKRPCVSFDLKSSEQQHECFHYTNLQPLWAKQNLCKSAKIIPLSIAA